MQQKQSLFSKILSEQNLKGVSKKQQHIQQNGSQISDFDSINIKKQNQKEREEQKIISINKMNPKLLKKSQSQVNFTKNLKQLSQLQTYTAQIMEQNLNCKKKMLEINAGLKETYTFVKNNFKNLFIEEKFLMTQFNQEDPMNFIKQFRKIFYILTQTQNNQNNKKNKQYQQLLNQNKNLNKANQRLTKYIEQWKTYSQGLKQKITKLKQIIKGYEVKKSTSQTKKQPIQSPKRQSFFQQQKIEQIINVQNIEGKLDIKYMNRNDLLLLIKFLMQKLKKHAKQCNDKVNKVQLADIQKFFNKDFSTAIKRSNSVIKQRLTMKQKERYSEGNFNILYDLIWSLFSFKQNYL